MQENQTNLLSDEGIADKHIDKVGVLLVTARNQKALSQADVADQINLPIRTIQALEEDDFEQLPEATYVRGYLRNFARAVGIDATELIAVYNDQLPVKEVEVIATNKKTKHSYDPTIIWSTAAVFTILVGLLVNWWMDERQLPEQLIDVLNDDSVQVSSTSTNSTGELISDSIQNSTDEDNVEKVEEIEQPSPVFEETESVNTAEDQILDSDVEQAMADESLKPNLVSLHDGVDVLTVTYMEKSWTEIRDADLNTLMQGLIGPGVVRNLSGKAPFHIFLGNSPGVVIEVNGQYFDQSEFNRSNRTARFQVSDGTFN